MEEVRSLSRLSLLASFYNVSDVQCINMGPNTQFLSKIYMRQKKNKVNFSALVKGGFTDKVILICPFLASWRFLHLKKYAFLL
jgi:hypothetical protein